MSVAVMTFDEWIDELQVKVIQEEYGYEQGEYVVTPSLWRDIFETGVTPLEAFEAALEAADNRRRT